MKGKVFSILFATVLAVSLCLVPAVVSADVETFEVVADGSPYNNVNARITKTDDLEAGVVEFMVEILDEPPYGGHIHTAATVYISTDINTVDFQVMYFNFTNAAIPTVTEFGWYYRAFPWTGIFDGVPFGPLAESGTGITATGDGAAGDRVHTVSIPIDLLGGPGATYYYAIAFSTNVQGSYPNGIRFCVEQDASNFATASVPANTAVGLTADVEDIVAINVEPTSIDFGTLKPGEESVVKSINIENIGTHTVDVDAYLTAWSSALFKDNLMLKNEPKLWTDWGVGTPWSNIVEDLVMGASDVVKTKLPVPTGYTPKGVETAKLIFEAVAIP